MNPTYHGVNKSHAVGYMRSGIPFGQYVHRWTAPIIPGLVLILAVLSCRVAVSQTTDVSESLPTLDSLYDGFRVSEIEIELPAEKWDTLRNQYRSEGEVLGSKATGQKYTWQQAKITIDGFPVEDAGVRKKGSLGSFSTSRPSLKINLEKFQDQPPEFAWKHLTLNNNLQDSSRVNHYLACQIFRDAGIPAARCGFARVTVNGKYLGVYLNVEPIKKGFLKRNFGEATGPLYEGMVADFFPERIQRMECKNDAAKLDHLTELIEAINLNPPDLERVEELVDMDAFFRFWAMESLLGAVDGYSSNQNNFWFYKKQTNDKFYFIPWGVDLAFTESQPIAKRRIEPLSVHHQSVLCNKFYRVPRLRRKYEETLIALIEEYWSVPVLTAEVTRLQDLLDPHLLPMVRRNSPNNYDRIRKFIRTRRDTVAEEFLNGPPMLKTREKMPLIIHTFGKAVMEFDAKWFDEVPSDFGEYGDVDIDLTIGERKVSFSRLKIVASPSKGAYSEEELAPPSVTFDGYDAESGERIVISVGLTAEDFRPTDGEMVRIGGIGFFDGKRRRAFGRVVFEAAERRVGARVKGKMMLEFTEPRGGNFLDY